MRTEEESFSISIASGSSTGYVDFTPTRNGVVKCINIAQNNAANAGVVRAKLTTNSGEEISTLSNIKNYEIRNGAGYYESQKPVLFATEGRTFRLTIAATENFTADFIADLTICYEPDFTKQNCN